MICSRTPTFRLVALLAVAGASAIQAAPSCHGLAATAVAFGSYDVYSGTTKVIPGTITYVCPAPITATVTIDAGLHPTGSQRAMQLAGGAELLLYDIYRDTNCLTRWDPASSTPVTAGSGTISFYACVVPLQDVTVGSYADTVTVTFNF
jgi:spore coat protein U-like protein